MNTKRFPSRLIETLIVTATLVGSLTAQSAIMGPYTANENTLHLWHLDETTVPANDSVLNGTHLLVLANGATLGDASFPGFGSALNTGVGNNTGYLAPLTYVFNSTADDVPLTYADTATGAFTYEAVLRVDFDPATITAAQLNGQPMYILTSENDGSVNRPWQWSVIAPATAGGNLTLRFLAGGSSAPNNFSVTIPTEGPDAIVQGAWYHVAVTFSGGPSSGTAKQYWTLMDATRTQANQIGSNFTLNNLNPKSSAAPTFQIGNVGRGANKQRWIGLIDEVRMSKAQLNASQMMFGNLFPSIVTQPLISQTNAVGQSVSFTVEAAGAAPLSYQWRFGGDEIPDANARTYTIPSPQLTNAGDYTVVITNDHGAVTSTVATLTMRIPSALTWMGSESDNVWNYLAVNWDTTGDAVADSAYLPGDHALFSDVGHPVVDIAELISPMSVTVNTSIDNIFTTSTGGALSGSSQLIKQGPGRLVINTDNTYSGPTVISEGMVQIGNADGRGSLGTGPITNNGTLLIDRIGTLVMANQIAGEGSLVKTNTGVLHLFGTNSSMSGNIVHNRGTIAVGPGAAGNLTNITMNASGGTLGTLFTLANGATLGAGTHFVAIGGGGDPGNRINLQASGGTNVWNGSIRLEGDSPATANVLGGSSMELNGPISGPDFNNVLSLRGGGSTSVLRGTVNLPIGGLQKDDGMTWIVNSTDNSYLFLRILAGPLKLGNDNAVATNSYVRTDGGVLDLAGFDQTVAGLVNTRATPQTVIANSSTTDDSRLTVATLPADPEWVSGAIIADSTAGGTRQVSLSLKGGATLVLTNANTYHGDTTIEEGILALRGIGSIGNSTPINLSAGTTLDASTRNDGTLTLNATQVLKGNGAFNVSGALVNNGTIELKLNKAGAILSNDSINNLSSITYGGTLRLDITASPALSTDDSFKLFNAGSYDGAFAAFEPTTPGSGLVWDTSTLVIDGTLRIATSTVDTNPTNITAAVVNEGTAFQISWPESHTGWTLQVQTNALDVGLSTNWVNVIGSSQTNAVISPINPANGSVFYRLVYP